MLAKDFINIIGASFFAGVPDSQLRALADYVTMTCGASGDRHRICADEGGACALAAGHYLATGDVPLVYLQNSGIGHIINPVASLMNEKVYAIPCIFVVGWRGEPGEHDEPQHIFQGERSEAMLEAAGITVKIIGKDTTADELERMMGELRPLLDRGKQVAFLVRKDALTNEKIKYKNGNTMRRETILEILTQKMAEHKATDDIIVSTTGKASRELFEIRERRGETHEKDFLTVGSMGHASMIALGIATEKKHRRVWIIDGDGAALMHMGAMAIIGTSGANNIVHLVINNGAHESVGGMPTAAGEINLPAVADACGYTKTYTADDEGALSSALDEIMSSGNINGRIFIEAKAAIGARDDLGRPTTTPIQNKDSFMKFLGAARKF